MIKLFLDDVRMPQHCIGYMNTRVNLDTLKLYLEEWVIVRNFDEFKEMVNKNIGNISHVSFDHDLEPEHYSEKMYSSMEEYYADIHGKGSTGLDCAKYMIKTYQEAYNEELPIIIVHSMNPVGTKAIQDVFDTV